MSIKITYKTGSNDRSVKNYVLFSDEEFKINGLSKLSISKSSNQISRLIISNKSEKKDFISFNLNSDQKIILIKINFLAANQSIFWQKYFMLLLMLYQFKKNMNSQIYI